MVAAPWHCTKNTMSEVSISSFELRTITLRPCVNLKDVSLESGAIECCDGCFRLLLGGECGSTIASLSNHNVLTSTGLVHMFLQSLVQFPVCRLHRRKATNPHLLQWGARELSSSLALSPSPSTTPTTALVPTLHRRPILSPSFAFASPAHNYPSAEDVDCWMVLQG